ncbi:hypothetical protein [Brachybacterium saurashtrense]|uniref:hypothetical protein n=1 Tax=Brachybacterium saurashtrense TaxID=556288 RepID=UPI001F493AD0|nr:hypothetical protein [Brachybacterium saurashtrense]
MDGTFWDPVPFSWPVLLLLLAACLLLTVGVMVWTALQPEEPEVDSAALVDRSTRRDQDAARTIRRRLDADAGRADAAEPELR